MGTKMKPKRKKKRAPADLTTRNARHYNKEFKQLYGLFNATFDNVVYCRRFCQAVFDVLKSKRLLTPAQCRLLEDCLR